MDRVRFRMGSPPRDPAALGTSLRLDRAEDYLRLEPAQVITVDSVILGAFAPNRDLSGRCPIVCAGSPLSSAGARRAFGIDAGDKRTRVNRWLHAMRSVV